MSGMLQRQESVLLESIPRLPLPGRRILSAAKWRSREISILLFSSQVEVRSIKLCSDPAIISLPAILRRPLARLIASRRAPIARKMYDEMGGRSPILGETNRQANALESELRARGINARCIIAMRCWHPLTKDAVAVAKEFSPDRIVLLPLYPQFSTTTTRSSLLEWRREAAREKVATSFQEICCYPYETGF